MFTARYGLDIYILFFICNPLKPSGHCMYRTVVTICTARFNIQQFYVLPTQCIYVFCVDLRTKQRLFPYTTLTDWYV